MISISYVLLPNCRVRIERAGVQINPDQAAGSVIKTDGPANVQTYDPFAAGQPATGTLDDDNTPAWRVRLDLSRTLPEPGDLLTITASTVAPYLVGVSLLVVRVTPTTGSMPTFIVYCRSANKVQV